MDNTGAATAFFYREDGTEMLIPDILSTRGALIKGTIQGNVVGDHINIRLRASKIVKQ